MAETVGAERRGDQLGLLLAEVDEGIDVRTLWRVEDCSEDGVLCSLWGLGGNRQVGESVGRPCRSRVNPWRKSLPWECPGGTGRSLHLHLLQQLVELLDRGRPDKPTVVMVENLVVLQTSPNSNPSHHSGVDRWGFSEGNPVNKGWNDLQM